MFQIDEPNAPTEMPAAPAPGTPAWFQGGNPATSTPGTRVRFWWLNMIQAELLAILAAAGIVPDKTNNSQVLAALRSLISGGAAAVAGATRNLLASVAAGSMTATFTADQIVVATALGGARFVLSGFNQTINLSTVGANGMDAGTAPANGYVAIYAIFNPTTQAAALLGVNATGGIAPTIYGNGQMPAGYTASALVSVLPISGTANEFKAASQNDRQIWIGRSQVFGTVTQAATPTAFSVAGACPLNARTCSGDFSVQNSTGQVNVCEIGSSASSIGLVASAGGSNATSQGQFNLPLIENDNELFYTASWNGSATYDVFVSGYTI